MMSGNKLFCNEPNLGSPGMNGLNPVPLSGISPNIASQSLVHNQRQMGPINNHHTNPGHHHPSQLFQNCTNLMPHGNGNGMNGLQSSSPSCIWSHPGLQPEKKPRIMNTPSSSISASSSTSQLNNSTNNEELISSSSPSNPNENNRHAHHHNSQNLNPLNPIQVTPDTSPPNSLWPPNVNPAYLNPSGIFNKCIIGINQLRLVEFSGFIEKRQEPEIVRKIKDFLLLLLLFKSKNSIFIIKRKHKFCFLLN